MRKGWVFLIFTRPFFFQGKNNMASITLTSNFVDGVDNSNQTGNFSTTLSSSNWVGGQETIGNSWAQLTFNSGSLTNVLVWSILNSPTTYSASVIGVATGSNGSGMLAAVYPGQLYTNTWTGQVWNSNNGIYVAVIGSWPSGSATPASASCQWKCQQA